MVLPARFIDIEGIDQSGKETQTRLLVGRLRRQGFKVATLGFPVYSSPAGREIRAFLEGKRDYPPWPLHMLYSLNRWENRDRIIDGLGSSNVLLTDRYTASNLAYGLAKGLRLDWLASLDAGLPRPDVVVVLDVPVDSSYSRKSRLRDIHERDRALLSRVRKNYLRLANKFRWLVIDGNRPIATVSEEIWQTVHGRTWIREPGRKKATDSTSR